MRQFAPLSGWLVVILATLPVQAQWPQFRGPEGDGISQESGLPETWKVTTNVAWRVPVAGKGWSSPSLDRGGST